MIMILIAITIAMLVGAMPSWPHSRQWGYLPSSTLGMVLLILVILAFVGRVGRI